MCGRTCLTLEPNQIRCACKYQSRLNQNPQDGEKQDPLEKSQFAMPEWRAEFNCGRAYTASYNIAPTDITPVLVSAAHFESDARDGRQSGERILVPMMWGMIPFWHKGDYRRHGLTTNNCRKEHMLESKLYRGPIRRGQRCVVLAEGFYEWQTTKSAKPSERAAYFLYMPQGGDAKIYSKSSWSLGEDGMPNVSLLKLAGLFDVREDEQGDKIYSYSIITFESSNLMAWLHHRMPAILETEEQLRDWLDFKHVSDEEALATLRPAKQLQWHRVSNMVNNSRQKSEQCNQPIELVASTKKPAMNKTMAAWLTVRKRREVEQNARYEDTDEDDNLGCSKNENDVENPPKRPKTIP